MVTRTVVCVSSSEAATSVAAKVSWSSSSGEADSIIKKASTPTNDDDGNNEERSGSNNNEVERHVELQVGFRTIRVQQRGAVRPAPTPAQPTTTNSNSSDNNKSDGGKKRALPSEDIIGGREVKKRQGTDRLVLDLSDVPPQQPIPKRKGHIKEGSSKYAGVTFNKGNHKWMAQIAIDGKLRYIGSYESEEAAAIDYTRAVFKYKGQEALDKMREQKLSGKETTKKHNRTVRFVLDLSDIPPQLPVPKSKGQIKEGTSKYIGVHFDKRTNKWEAQIRIEGKQRQRRIGWYENEEEAAIDYARAVLKYKGQRALNNLRERNNSSAPLIDLSDVPPQLPILKRAGQVKEGASKYAGVTFDKGNHNWRARITIEGNLRHIGSYENEEEAAIDYARAVFKYKGQGALGKARGQNFSIDDVNDVPPQPKRQRRPDPEFVLDLSDVPTQPLLLKSKERIKEGSSKYAGVSFLKSRNKWMAQIMFDGKQHYIGCYENEEEAAADYARAVFKFKGQNAVDKAREQNKQSAPAAIDLSDVPPQQPIPKSKGRIKEGAMVTRKLVRITSPEAAALVAKETSLSSAAAEDSTTVNKQPPTFLTNDNKNETGGGKKRALPSEDNEISGKETTTKRQRTDKFVIDLSDVPRQLPILKSKGKMKEGASSKYTGVSFHKSRNKWMAQITIDGKQRSIGLYENEEEAAIDYARAVFKYKRQGALDKARGQNSAFDLSDVPSQQPIPKSEGHIKEGSSKYIGVYFHKPANKWLAQIRIDGKQLTIGFYENEEEAAIDYARAVFKYKGQEALNNLRERNLSAPSIELSDVPPQQPILKSEGRIKEGSSKYTGIHFNKARNKWHAQITFEGKKHHIGLYENEEEAATEYARAVFKYKRQGALDKASEQKSSGSGEQKSSGSGTVTSYSTSNNDAAYRYKGEKKRDHTSEASISYEETTAIKHQRINAFGKRNFLPHVIPIKATSVAATKASNISSAPIVQTNQQHSHYWHTPWQWQWQWHH